MVAMQRTKFPPLLSTNPEEKDKMVAIERKIFELANNSVKQIVGDLYLVFFCFVYQPRRKGNYLLFSLTTPENNWN